MSTTTGLEILAPTDFSAASAAAVAAACQLADRLRCRLRLLHTYATSGFTLKDAAWMLTADELNVVARGARNSLDEVASGIRLSHPSVALETVLLQAEPVTGILGHIEETKPRFVVMATHGRGFWSSAIVGTVARRVVKRATRPVMTIRAPVESERAWSVAERSTILVPIDIDAVSVGALEFAIALAKDLQWSLRVLHAYRGPDSWQESVDERASRWHRDAARSLERLVEAHSNAGVHMEALVTRGPPLKVILEAASSERVGLVAMGVHGPSGLLQALSGTIAQEVVRLAPCPVVTWSRMASDGGG